ncbi:Coiled-coil domain-containing protein 22-like protein [Phytophthora ramorum]|uniref:Coiled-coil domain-containing protein 22-like protein n=1 Tax=Phytophthora ramorum TaxID=164328 RepID=UPI0030AA7E6D|nr:Coiled-coil domain-containing protein 22-like protein [Phytophthora ramorum]
MAEADAFILAALQQSGWLEAAEQTSSWTVTELSSDALIGVVLRFLKQLQDADDSATFTLPSAGVKAPVGVAARHRVGSQLANILKELGYAGDCGYNHFLYPSEKETRNILSWLVGKLPRSKLEGNEEDGGKSEVLVAGVDTAGWQDSVLESKQLADIFSSWKREKTLYVLPSNDVEELRGFQRLPLRTSPLELPWSRPGKSTRKLFEGFPSDSVKVTSLLEALAVEKRGATILLREDEFDEEVDMGEVEIQGELKAATSAGEGGFLAPQETEAEGDEFAAIQSQSFVAGGLPDVPLSLDSSSSGAGVAPEEGSLVESGGSSSLDSKKAVGDMNVIQGQEQKEKSEQSLEEVQKQVDDTEHRIAAMRKVLDRERGELQAVEQHVRQTQTTGQDIQKQVARQKQLMAMLPQAQANIAKLEAICQTNAEKKAEIVQQMEIARGPLLKEYTELEGQKSSRKARCRQLIHEIKTFRTEMLEITGIIHSKMESVGALEKIQERQLAKLGKKKHPDGGPMTRNMYTSRIMDIIKQVHKQKQDIAKILEDIKGLQKQLNISAEKLKRTEAVADEKIYSAASKSKSSSSTKAEAYVDCYRKFAQVRELFEDLILVIGDVGKKENAARDLHNWISQLEARDSRSNLDKVLADLESVRQENGTLQNELHARIA